MQIASVVLELGQHLQMQLNFAGNSPKGHCSAVLVLPWLCFCSSHPTLMGNAHHQLGQALVPRRCYRGIDSALVMTFVSGPLSLFALARPRSNPVVEQQGEFAGLGHRDSHA